MTVGVPCCFLRVRPRFFQVRVGSLVLTVKDARRWPLTFSERPHARRLAWWWVRVWRSPWH